MAPHPLPKRVEIKVAARRLDILWSDQHTSSFPFRYLRGFCPCAGCQGHRPGPKQFIREDDPQVDEVRLVGRYALTPVWKDSHATGIYTFEYLRELCPCSDCKPEGLVPEYS